MVDRCDERILLSTFTVTSLADSGEGTLRQAMMGADSATDGGPEVIDFDVAGTIVLTSGTLPTITEPVLIDGTTAPGFASAGRPVVEVDNGGFDGLEFGIGSAGSTLKGLAIDDSGSDGITINASNITVVGDYIGVGLDGGTLQANAGNGIVINANSSYNTIGATSTVADGSVISTASNVISGNGLNGIAVYNSSYNTIVANYIGTDATGLKAQGNGGSGILIDANSDDNTIGGTTPFVGTGVVPSSNLISANHIDGILIDNESSENNLSANFVGTDVTGQAALGNLGDGIEILSASNDNVLSGTTATQNPFIYANIVSGNLGNGLQISNSDNTQVLANFFGLGYGNTTPVGNGEDGVLINGASTGTLFGGLIPLGNVCASNGGNGLEIDNLVSNTLVSNTFDGVAAFSTQSNLGNDGDGMLITSSGGGISIHTGNIVSRNGDNGIELSGIATGVAIYADLIGTNTNGTIAMPNGENGVLIDGNAHDNSIGSLAVGATSTNPTTNAMNATRTIISGNTGNGVAVVGSAYDNQIINCYIGIATLGGGTIPNGGSGVYLGELSLQTTVGGSTSGLGNVISGNLGNGITINSSGLNVIQGDEIGTDPSGLTAFPNGGDGVLVNISAFNLIGGTTAGAPNTIAFNEGGGVLVNAGFGASIRRNSIFNNQDAGIVLQSDANGDETAPLLTHTKKEGPLLGIGGNLQAKPDSTYQIELFSNEDGQTSTTSGQTYLSTQTVTTNAQGFVRFRFYVMPSVAKGVFFTTTATSKANDTSEFSDRIPQ
jgi:parallel beta-helix repeat protein